MLFVDDDKSKVLKWIEESRAGADRKTNIARMAAAPGLAPLREREVTMNNRKSFLRNQSLKALNKIYREENFREEEYCALSFCKSPSAS